MAHVLAVDAGTTSVRTFVVDGDGTIVDVAARELTQHFPRPGWVEHDPGEIWAAVRATIDEVTGRLCAQGGSVEAVGITNQRETVVAWDRRSGRPRHRAIVWQDRRTSGRCDDMAAAGHLPTVRQRTGLVLDPYFSATKMAWLLTDGGVEKGSSLALGTVDAWILWNLTGGAAGGAFATDTTNASRTLLFDIVTRTWSDELCDIFGVPRENLPDVQPTCGRFGVLAAGVGALAGGPVDRMLTGVPVTAMAGDQHAALFGQACTSPGMAKVTYGTGSFVLLNAGTTCPAPAEGLLTTVAWDLGDHAGAAPPVTYALEGSVFTSGSAIQWLRDGLGIIDSAAEIEPLARSVDDAGDVVVVPAFAGLGSPWWDPRARGAVVGLTRGAGRAQLARAVVAAMAHQVRDVTDAMAAATGTQVTPLRVDGGAAVMDLLVELQSDMVQTVVTRPTVTETTGLGAAFLAGLAAGIWTSVDDATSRWHAELECRPTISPEEADRRHAAWHRAVERSRRWTIDEPSARPGNST